VVVSVGPQRQLARPLSVVQRQSLTALGVPTACCTTPNSGEGVLMAAARLSRLQKRMLWWLAVDHQRTRGLISSSHQELVRTLQSDKSNISHSLRTLEVRGLLVIGRSSGGHAESLSLTQEGQKRAAQLAGSCD